MAKARRPDAVELVEKALADPDATLESIMIAAVRTVVHNELQKPGVYGSAGLPNAIEAMGTAIAAGAGSNEDAFDKFVEWVNKNPEEEE